VKVRTYALTSWEGRGKLAQFLPAFIDHKNWHLGESRRDIEHGNPTELAAYRTDADRSGDPDGRGRDLREIPDMPAQTTARGSLEIIDYGLIAAYLMFILEDKGTLSEFGEIAFA
jgi:hypothetical protein